jgi:hypothetical protein
VTPHVLVSSSVLRLTMFLFPEPNLKRMILDERLLYVQALFTGAAKVASVSATCSARAF